MGRDGNLVDYHGEQQRRLYLIKWGIGIASREIGLKIAMFLCQGRSERLSKVDIFIDVVIE